MDGMLIIGQSTTWPTDIYVKKYGQTLRAVRVTNFEKLDSAELRELSEEILIQRKLRSPYIAEVLSCQVVGLDVRQEMEYFGFGSAADIVSAHFHTGLPYSGVSIIVKGVCQALDYCHSQRIIHRSVRSSHVFISESGQVKLSGFRHAIEMQDPALSEDNGPPKVHAYKYDPVGLPWKAPELLEQNCAGYDSKIDIYSLGILLCELLNGLIPFIDQPATLIMLEKLKGSQPMVMDRTTLLDPDYPPKYKPYLERRIPKHFHLLVQHLTMRNPSKRPCAKVILKRNLLKVENGALLREKLKPMKPMRLIDIEKELSKTRVPQVQPKTMPSFEWDYSD